MPDSISRRCGKQFKLLVIHCCIFLSAADGQVHFNLQHGSQSPFYATSVIGDSSTCRFSFAIQPTKKGKPDYAVFPLKIQTDNPLVLPESNVNLYHSPEQIILQAYPLSEGYCRITIFGLNGDPLFQQILELAVSDPGKAHLPVQYHSGFADASAVIMLNDSTALVADDEQNRLAAYHPGKSAPPLWQVAYDRLVPFPACRKDRCDEADIEAAVRSPFSPQLLYFFGSMSNGKAPKSKLCPNRNFLFAARFTEKNEIKIDHSCSSLRDAIIRWGNKLGFRFSSAAAEGQDAKSPEGFNLEGATFAPDSNTLLLGMRAPLHQGKAILIPVTDFEQWVDNDCAKKPEIGNPIFLDLGGRGIRDIVRARDGSYIIVAGNSNQDNRPALFRWSGNTNESPAPVGPDCSGLNMEGIAELWDGHWFLICDDGSEVLYGDGIPNKNLGNDSFKKFRATTLFIPSIKNPVHQ